MIRVAVTGGIACGKSLVASMLVAAGWAVCEADLLAHGLMQPGTVWYGQLIALFGEAVLAADGTIDRGALGAWVFSDPQKRKALNAVLHPAVWAKIQQWQQAECRQGTRAAAAVIPLLYEAQMARGWDAVICVATPARLQESRLLARGIDPDGCRARIGAQMPQEEKMRKADFVIWNDGSADELLVKVKQTLKVIEEKYA